MENIALITGGTGGIGRAIALGLAKDGHDVWLNYRSDELAAKKIAAAIEERGRQCRLLRFDVTDRHAVEICLAPLLEESVPAVLVINAGIARDSVFGLMSDEDWDSVLDVDLNGFFNVARRVVPHMMRARKGRIISIASVSGQAGNAGQVNYSAAKAAIIGASRALAKEVGKRGILVNVVSPGIIETEMTKNLPLEKMIAHIPLGRAGSPEDVAGCVRFLCSDLAGYITGQVLAVNGGLYS